ncbi:MAG: metallophosphoesterase [Pseudolabrys sp.]
MFTLAHLSDPHLAPLPSPRLGALMSKRLTGWINWQRKRRFVHVRAVLDTLVADLKAQDADHIAVTGDLTNIALKEEFARARDWLNALGSPENVSVIPGNHDVYVSQGLAYALTQWGPYMGNDDGTVGFPYLRRRGDLALIGLSSGVASAPFMATGHLGEAQLAKLGPLLDAMKKEGCFRVVMVHHPPISQAKSHKRLIDAAALKQVLAEHGAELLLHGHDHLAMLNWLADPDSNGVPAVGVPSASAAPGMSHDAAAYNLYTIGGAPGAWTCEMVARGVTPSGDVVEQKQVVL